MLFVVLEFYVCDFCVEMDERLKFIFVDCMFVVILNFLVVGIGMGLVWIKFEWEWVEMGWNIVGNFGIFVFLLGFVDSGGFF